MAFGVVLPEDLGKSTAPEVEPSEGSTESAPSGAKDLAPEGDGAKELAESPEPQATKEKEALDLDKLESFRFAGRNWTPKDLKNAYLMREDYTRKTQEIAEARKYADNFTVDLQAVIQDPGLIEKLRAVYPKAYVDVAEKVLARMQPSVPGTQQAAPTQNADPALQKWREQVESKLSRLDQWEEAQKHAEIEKIESWLTNTYDTLSKKYPLADNEVITARAQVLSDNGHKIDEKVLDKLFKQNDEETKTRWEKVYKEKVNKQLEAGQRSKDTGSGGGVPGNAPRGFKTIKEATQTMLKDFGAS